MRRILPLVIAAALALGTAPAFAAVECKSTANLGIALTESTAVANWRTAVTQQYGSSWANFDIASGKAYSVVNAGPVPMHHVSAKACRITPKQIFTVFGN